MGKCQEAIFQAEQLQKKIAGLTISEEHELVFADKTAFRSICPVNIGLSGDMKYHLETAAGLQLFLRLSDISERSSKESMFMLLQRVAELGVPMPYPVAFGECNQGKNVFQLLTWCEGVSVETCLPDLPETTQHSLGQRCGEILRKIHAIPAPENLDDWAQRYMDVNSARLAAFSRCGVHIPGSDVILRYVEENKHLLKGRPQCFHHGDYHSGNLLLAQNHDICVIDWEILDYGNFADPWEEFNRLNNAEVIPRFATGLLQGYFGGEPPADFWRLLAFYLGAGALMLVSWAYYLQRDMLAYTTENVRTVLSWFDQMENCVPTWYLKD